MTELVINGEITTRETTKARVLNWLPWLSFFLAALPLPTVFLVLFLGAVTTEAHAVYLFLVLASLGIGTAAGLVLVAFLMLYRRRWLRRLRDKLAADGITASELEWFISELTTAERKTLDQTKARSPLLADAYSETLATRLMATRLIDRTKRELLSVERRLNRVALIRGADTTTLQKALETDRNKLDATRQEAAARLAETQARLHTIEAAASRDLSHGESYQMLQRLSAAQEHLPLSLEMAQLQQRALEEAEHEVGSTTPP
jgi:hypothetical protein